MAFQRAVVMAKHYTLSLKIREVLLTARGSGGTLSDENERKQVSRLQEEQRPFESAIRAFASVTSLDYDNGYFMHLKKEHSRLFPTIKHDDSGIPPKPRFNFSDFRELRDSAREE